MCLQLINCIQNIKSVLTHQKTLKLDQIIFHLRPIWHLQLKPFRNENNLKVNSPSVKFSQIFQFYNLSSWSCSSFFSQENQIFLNRSFDRYVIKCIFIVFQELFSEFNYFNYFKNYVVMKCYKRKQSYCISHQFAMLFDGNFTFFSVFIYFPCYSMGNMHFFGFFF